MPIEGMLFVPVEWELADLELEVRLLEALDHHVGSQLVSLADHELEGTGVPGYFRFALPGMQPGRYQATLVQLAHSEILEVGPRGLFDARIVAPPPRVLVARCFEEGSGSELSREEVHLTWESASESERRPGRPIVAEWGPDVRGWRMRVPEERVLLRASGAGWLAAELVVEPGPGMKDVRLELARSYELVLKLREGARPLPWDARIAPRLIPIDGQPDLISVRILGGAIGLVKRAPGRYRLELATLPGYLPIAPCLIDLQDTTSEHVLELVRPR